MIKINPTIIFIVLYALTGAFPYLEASDKIHSQMMYLSILNTCSIYYIFNYLSNSPVSFLNKYFNKIPIFIFLLFFMWTIIAVIPAINIQESLVQLTYYFLRCFSTYNLEHILDTLFHNRVHMYVGCGENSSYNVYT